MIFSIKNLLILLSLTLLGISLFFSSKRAPQSAIRIGIVLPIEHTALRLISDGFQEQFSNLCKKPIIFDEQNAQGDPTLLNCIIRKMVTDKVDLIVPVGKAASQAVISMESNRTVVSLAANLSEQERQANPSCRITGVTDEFEKHLYAHMIRHLFPSMKKIAIVHSATEKVLPEVAEFVSSATKLNFCVQKCMIQALSDLYTVTKSIDKDVQAIFVLKDHLVVSGIKTLAAEAATRTIPLITADQGSVENGADFSLGVEEKEVGRHGASLSKKILDGTIDPKHHTIEKINRLVIFVNKKVPRQSPLFGAIGAYAKASGFDVQTV